MTSVGSAGSNPAEPATNLPADPTAAGAPTTGRNTMTQPETPAVWIDGHPQLEAIAAAVWEQCGRSDSGMCVEDDPRNIAVAAFAAVLPASAGRAAVLTEAADVADRLMDERYGPDCSYAIGGEVVATELRRLAAEAHDGDTQDDGPPAPLRRSEDDCPGFPEQCPNLRPVDPDPPAHYGGIRCGCADQPSAVLPVGSAEPAHDEPCGGRSHREHLARECPVVRYGERCACDEPVTEEQDRG